MWLVVPVAHGQHIPIIPPLPHLLKQRLVPIRPLQAWVPFHVHPREALPLDLGPGRRVAGVPRGRPQRHAQAAGPGPRGLAAGEGGVVGGEGEGREGAGGGVDVEVVFVLPVVVARVDLLEEVEVHVFGPEDCGWR